MSVLLEDFKQSVRSVVRPNRFEVEIVAPTSLKVPVDADELMFRVQSATIPDRTFNEIPVKFYGMEYKLPGGETTTDLNITFLNDAEWDIRDFFEGWAELINNRSTSEKAFADELFEDGTLITVYQLGFDGKRIAGYEFYHIFPKIVEQIELNMETTDTVETFQVTFAYSYWKQTESSDE